MYPAWAGHQWLLRFTLPFIVDADAEPIQAIQRSFEMLKTQWLMAALFHFVAALLGVLGIVACGVGVVFTVPLFLLSMALQYVQFTQMSSGTTG